MVGIVNQADPGKGHCQWHPLGLMSNAAARRPPTRGWRPKTSTAFYAGWLSQMPGRSIRKRRGGDGNQSADANQVDIGGASPAGMVCRAAAAIQAGMCQAVLCVVGDLNKFGDQKPPVISVQREFERRMEISARIAATR